MKPHASKTAEELFQEHYGFMALMARQLGGHYRVEMEDLMQQGRLGILRAMESYDPNRGNNFLTYARHWIKRRMQEWIWKAAHNVRIPNQKFGKVFFSEESLHWISAEDDELEREIGVDESVRALADRRHIQKLLAAAVGRLSHSQSRVMIALFYDGLDEKTAARKLGITRAGVNVAKQTALRKLRQMPDLRKELQP